MRKMKIYMRTTGDIKKQAETYINVFGGKLLKCSLLNQQDTDNNLKPSKDIYTYAYITLGDEVNIMLAKYHSSMPDYGYQSDIILTFSDNDEFLSVLENMQNNKEFTHDYGPKFYEFGGGITLAKFFDKWGFGWVIETKK